MNKISYETASKMMDVIAFTLCRTVCQAEPFNSLSDEVITEFVNDYSKDIFITYCESENIDEVEEEN